ncbi:FkbM family methyltransferase [Lacibacter sp. H375]|uniref:FkbM family methyltransferase n=1 Tax=Lacibacter sp. H375 TaxID=3133424 RepID=UPI0030BB1CFE
MIPSGYKRNIKEQLGVPSLHWSLKNLKLLGFTPSFVVDIGAYEGYWTRDFLEVYPDAKILMLEAQSAKLEKLKRVCNDFSNAQYHIALLSPEDGKEFSFIESETASHVTDEIVEGAKKLRGEALDQILERKQLPFPDFLKLDVQGFELEVLKGAAKSLAHTQFCILEVSLLDLDGTPMMLEVMNYMDSKGFQAYDICQFMRRPLDKALYQIDLLFIKKDSNLIASKRWM